MVKRREPNWKSREKGQCKEALKGEIFPYGYDPTIYRHRLTEPLKVKAPSRIFTVDTGDAFGAWVPREWIEKILEVIAQCPQHTFQILTKNPLRLREFTFPSNCWVGVTVNTQADHKRVRILKEVNARVRFLSIEPLLGSVSFRLEGIGWVIIGAQTGANPPAPDPRWVEVIRAEADRLSIPVFEKDNLAPYFKSVLRKSYPA
jgi:protein gp37